MQLYKFCDICGEMFDNRTTPTGSTCCSDCLHKKQPTVIGDTRLTRLEEKEIRNALVTNEGILLPDQEPMDEEDIGFDDYFDTDEFDSIEDHSDDFEMDDDFEDYSE